MANTNKGSSLRVGVGRQHHRALGSEPGQEDGRRQCGILGTPDGFFLGLGYALRLARVHWTLRTLAGWGGPTAGDPRSWDPGQAAITVASLLAPEREAAVL